MPSDANSNSDSDGQSDANPVADSHTNSNSDTNGYTDADSAVRSGVAERKSATGIGAVKTSPLPPANEGNVYSAMPEFGNSGPKSCVVPSWTAVLPLLSVGAVAGRSQSRGESCGL